MPTPPTCLFVVVSACCEGEGLSICMPCSITDIDQEGCYAGGVLTWNSSTCASGLGSR